MSEYVAVPEDTAVITCHINRYEMASMLNLGTNKVCPLQQKYPNGHNPVPDPTYWKLSWGLCSQRDRAAVLEESRPCPSCGVLCRTCSITPGHGDGMTSWVRRLRTAVYLHAFDVCRQTCTNSVRKEANLIVELFFFYCDSKVDHGLSGFSRHGQWRPTADGICALPFKFFCQLLKSMSYGCFHKLNI